jgi:hypothetical protein
LGLRVKNDFNTGRTYLEASGDCVELQNSLLVIDEASMVDLELLGHIQQAAEWYNCKILYVGDSYQLPPINEDNCPIFRQIKNTHFLTDIHRQAADSNIISFSNEYRVLQDTIEKRKLANKYNEDGSIASQMSASRAYDLGVDHLISDEPYVWPHIPNNEVDIIRYPTPYEWGNALKEAYTGDHDPDDLRILAWTNKVVNGYNKWIRNEIGLIEPFENDEILIANNVVIMDRMIVCGIGQQFKVTSAREKVEQGVEGYMLSLMGVGAGGFLRIFQPTDQNHKKDLLNTLADKANGLKGRDRSNAWQKFFEVKDGWGDFRPLHSQTVHKSQGSTYKEVFIDLNDIGKNRSDMETARLMYVSATRASEKIHLYGAL